MRLEVRTDRIVRVTAVADGNLELPASLIVAGPKPAAVPFKVERPRATMSRSPLRDSSRTCRWPMAPSDSPTLPARRCSRRRLRVFRQGRLAAFQHRHLTKASSAGPAPVRRRSTLNGEDVELAQHNMRYRRAVRGLDAATMACSGITTRISRFGNPKPYGLASRDLKIRDASGKEGGFTARYSIDGELKARARREGHQLPLHQRPLDLAEGTARWQDAATGSRRTSCRTSR